jgi:hypothetical protein
MDIKSSMDRKVCAWRGQLTKRLCKLTPKGLNVPRVTKPVLGCVK